MSSIVTSQTIPLRLQPGAVMMWYGNEWKQYSPIYSKFFKSMKTNKAFEDIVSIAGTGLPILKTEGGEYTLNDISRGHVARLIPKRYGQVIVFTYESLSDDQYSPKLDQMVGQWFAKGEKEHKERTAHNVLNDGFSTVGNFMYTNPDAKALFATDHPNPKGGTFANKLSVDADLSEASLEDMDLLVRSMTDETGVIKMAASSMKLIVSNNDKFNAERLLFSSGRVNTANNDLNAVGRLGLELIVSPYITDTDSWFIITDADPGLIMLEREGLRIENSNEFLNDNSMVKCVSRFAVGYANARGVFGSSGG